MTKSHSKLSHFSLALAVAFGALTFTACGAGGADESKAPKIKRDGLGYIYVISQDDDTVIKGVTVSGRNGKCEKQTVKFGDDHNTPYADKETCARYNSEACFREFGHLMAKDASSDEDTIKPVREKCFQKCSTPAFDGQKLAYGDAREVYWIRDNCPPKNGAWRVEIETNFGTYAYELK